MERRSADCSYSKFDLISDFCNNLLSEGKRFGRREQGTRSWPEVEQGLQCPSDRSGSHSDSTPGFGRQTRVLDVTEAEDVEHLLPRGDQIVRDDPAMASPPEAFRAHDGRARCVTKRSRSVLNSSSGTLRSARSRRSCESSRCPRRRWRRGIRQAAFRASRRARRNADTRFRAGASEAGEASRLNCGLVRERGTVRTSTTSLTSAAVKSAELVDRAGGDVRW